MLFEPPLIPGRLVKRYKRFLADVLLPDGTEVTAHCPNTGAMTGCADPGMQVYLRPSTNPKRKLPFTWELSVTDEGHWIGIQSANANQLVEEAILAEQIPELEGYASVRREVKYGDENSRIDLLLQHPDKADCYVEVKSVTLLDKDVGRFPDAVSTRGQKHLRELAALVKQGKRAVLFFCAQHTGIEGFAVAQDIDPEYARLFADAVNAGVEVVAYNCLIAREKISVEQKLPVSDTKIP